MMTDSMAGTLLWLLPLALGVATFAVFIASFHPAFSPTFNQQRELLKTSWVELSLTPRTLVLLLSAVLILVPIAREMQQGDLAAAHASVAEMRRQVESRQQLSAFIYLQLPGDGALAERADELECVYRLSTQPDRDFPVPVRRSPGGGVMVLIPDLTKEIVVNYIELREKGSRRVLGHRSFVKPLEETVQLIARQPGD